MQTSFMHPPFGFALFYLRSVAPTEDYKDRLTQKLIPKVTTGQIYWGAVPFVVIQIIMVAMIIAFPNLVSTGTAPTGAENTDNVQIMMPSETPATTDDASKMYGGAAPAAAEPASAGASAAAKDDPAAMFK